jgi:hypothetical protein
VVCFRSASPRIGDTSTNSSKLHPVCAVRPGPGNLSVRSSVCSLMGRPDNKNFMPMFEKWCTSARPVPDVRKHQCQTFGGLPWLQKYTCPLLKSVVLLLGPPRTRGHQHKFIKVSCITMGRAVQDPETSTSNVWRGLGFVRSDTSIMYSKLHHVWAGRPHVM